MRANGNERDWSRLIFLMCSKQTRRQTTGTTINRLNRRISKYSSFVLPICTYKCTEWYVQQRDEIMPSKLGNSRDRRTPCYVPNQLIFLIRTELHSVESISICVWGSVRDIKRHSHLMSICWSTWWFFHCFVIVTILPQFGSYFLQFVREEGAIDWKVFESCF